MDYRMDMDKEQAQVPEEELDSVSGGSLLVGKRLRKHFICNKCEYETDINYSLGMDPQGMAQFAHNTCKGKTGTCEDGIMEAK